ncbi:MAG: hypothetical protein ACREQY_00735, partial [Candidatus Binatia bacterium]
MTTPTETFPGSREHSTADVELSHPDRHTLEMAGQRLAAELATYAGVSDIDDGVLLGKPQLDFKLTAAG